MNSSKESKSTKARARRLSTFFRLSLDDYDRIEAYQRRHHLYRLLLGKAHYKNRDAVEHRHKDGLVRGVMANMLNRAYGTIERLYPTNTSDVLRALAEFHDHPPATAALGAPRYGIIGKAQHKRKMLYGPPPGRKADASSKQ